MNWLPLLHSLTWDKTATRVCAPNGNCTGNPSLALWDHARSVGLSNQGAMAISMKVSPTTLNLTLKIPYDTVPLKSGPVLSQVHLCQPLMGQNC